MEWCKNTLLIYITYNLKDSTMSNRFISFNTLSSYTNEKCVTMTNRKEFLLTGHYNLYMHADYRVIGPYLSLLIFQGEK